MGRGGREETGEEEEGEDEELLCGGRRQQKEEVRGGREGKKRGKRLRCRRWKRKQEGKHKCLEDK